ncbi:hypothetical protein [Solimicrobium silvestre]|uniref:Uncharacterized protein n=1 Tax=Solimicrobium silvestre TaxID=2099400 RepID=A0A2S9GSV2_9BURK|nr:hypothetical protein [Solimicrobium silvestre]PRC90797.1 hypothetical protein S2091_4460 [Solimicrobium silvestre]
MPTKIEHRRHGRRRFCVTLDNRYEFYSWPEDINVKCPNCGSPILFNAVVPDQYVKDEKSGGYLLVPQSVATKIRGRGACTKCSRQFDRISWPEDAHFKFESGGGIVWAWNKEFLQVLRARVIGDRVTERQLCMKNGLFHYFLTRLPKYIVVKRHRAGILRKLDELT